MTRFIELVDWTDQGVKTFKETVDRAGLTYQLADTAGPRVVDIYWTLG